MQYKSKRLGEISQIKIFDPNFISYKGNSYFYVIKVWPFSVVLQQILSYSKHFLKVKKEKLFDKKSNLFYILYFVGGHCGWPGFFRNKY